MQNPWYSLRNNSGHLAGDKSGGLGMRMGADSMSASAMDITDDEPSWFEHFGPLHKWQEFGQKKEPWRDDPFIMGWRGSDKEPSWSEGVLWAGATHNKILTKSQAKGSRLCMGPNNQRYKECRKRNYYDVDKWLPEVYTV